MSRTVPSYSIHECRAKTRLRRRPAGHKESNSSSEFTAFMYIHGRFFPADEPTVFFVLDETPIRSLILKWNYSPAHYSFPLRFISRLSSSNSFVVISVA